MHSRFRAKGVTLAVLAALTALLVLPGTSLAKPQPGAGRGFRLQARAIGAITINRVYCGLAATGEICVDSTNSSTIGGGYWPKGAAAVRLQLRSAGRRRHPRHPRVGLGG